MTDDFTEILTVEQMYAADRFAIEAGQPGERLMEAAGRAVTDEIMARWDRRPVSVLCGPGGNGGDGFVVARLLRAAGWPVRVGLLRGGTSLHPDTEINMKRWTGEVSQVDSDLCSGSGLVVDALFGAGLTRALDEDLRGLMEQLNGSGLPIVSIDVPSGVHGNTGEILGAAPRASLTVTFFRRKPGHLLYSGRACAGMTVVADIGIPEASLEGLGVNTYANQPGLWLDCFRWPGATDHKYSRGHVVVSGGNAMTGAARLAARAARRIGAGLVTVAASPDSLPVYAADSPGLLIEPFATAEEFERILEDERRNAVLVGPGNGVNRTTLEVARSALASGRNVVLDADALTVFSDQTGELFDGLQGVPAVLTPHEGEFSRLFDVAGSRLDRARKAADLSGAIVLLKGADSVIAAPGGLAAINENAPPTLATAGSGDVLAGLVAGLMAQGMPPFESACAGVWLHGAAAGDFGMGLIAEDICEGIPAVIERLFAATTGSPGALH